MSVILTEMDMPDNCLQCPCLHHGEYGEFEKSWCNLDSKLRISDRNCPNVCKIKSVDELIETLNAARYCDSAHYSENALSCGIQKSIEIIKEYCEMEDENVG